MALLTILAEFDAEANVWVGSNSELPLTTEAATLDGLLSRILDIAPEIAVENHFINRGDELRIQLVTGQTSVRAA